MMRIGQLAALLIMVVRGRPARADDSTPPGMVEVPTPSRAATMRDDADRGGAAWWHRASRRLVGFNLLGGVSCITVSSATGGCFGLARAGFEFGWGDIHVGGLFVIGDAGYDPFDHLDEDGGWSSGVQVGAEVGSPYMKLSPRVRLALRGAIDHDVFTDGNGNWRYSPTFTNNAAVAITLGAGFCLLARAGIGLGLPWNLVIDGGAGILFAR